MQMQAAFKCVGVKKSSERKETEKKSGQTKRRTKLATTTEEMGSNVKNKQKK